MPGGGYALPGLRYGRRVQAQQAGQAPRPPAKSSGCVPVLMPGGGYALPVLMPGGGCALPGLESGLEGASIVGRASAAPPGKVFRPRTRPDARWRLRLTGPGVWPGGRKHCRPGKRRAARQKSSGRVPGLMPGGGCALPGLGSGLEGASIVGRASAAPPGKRVQAAYPS